MNPSSVLLVFSLLLLSLLHSKSQGILLDEGLSLDSQNLLKRSDSGGWDEEEANINNQIHSYISIAGKEAKNRKLLVPPSIPCTHHTTSKKTKKMIENNENAKGNREGEEKNLKKQLEEEVDMAEMDYTAAKRKPPIHN